MKQGLNPVGGPPPRTPDRTTFMRVHHKGVRYQIDVKEIPEPVGYQALTNLPRKKDLFKFAASARELLDMYLTVRRK